MWEAEELSCRWGCYGESMPRAAAIFALPVGFAVFTAPCEIKGTHWTAAAQRSNLDGIDVGRVSRPSIGR